MLLAGAMVGGFVGLGTATMVYAAPRYVAVCPTDAGGDCAAISTGEPRETDAATDTAVVALGGTEGSSLTLVNNNVSGTARLEIIGSFDAVNPSTGGTEFVATSAATKITVVLEAGESRDVVVPGLPASARSVLVKLAEGGGTAASRAAEGLARVDVATGGAGVTSDEVRAALDDLRKAAASASPSPDPTAQRDTPRIDDVVEQVIAETSRPVAPDVPDRASGPTPDRNEPAREAASGAAPGKDKPEPKPEPEPEPVKAPAPVPKPVAAEVPATQGTGRPGGGNTGVPAGTRLKPVQGDIVVTTAGTVIDSADIRGRVIVKAPNVTIKNSIIRGSDSGSKYGLIDALAGHPGLRVIDTEIVATSPNYLVNGIMGYNFELRRVNIHGVIDQVHITGSNVVVADSWLHDNLHYEDDPSQSDGSHDDNVQIQKGQNISITNNVMEDANNAAIQITQDAGVVANVTISGNRADHGGCTMNISEKGRGPILGVRIVDNTFGRGSLHADCAVIGPSSSPVKLSGNVYTDGKAVSMRKG